MQIVCHVGTFHKCDNRDKLDSMLKIIQTKLITKKRENNLIEKKKVRTKLKVNSKQYFHLKKIVLYKSRTKFPSKRLKKL